MNPAAWTRTVVSLGLLLAGLGDAGAALAADPPGKSSRIQAGKEQRPSYQGRTRMQPPVGLLHRHLLPRHRLTGDPLHPTGGSSAKTKGVPLQTTTAGYGLRGTRRLRSWLGNLFARKGDGAPRSVPGQPGLPGENKTSRTGGGIKDIVAQSFHSPLQMGAVLSTLRSRMPDLPWTGREGEYDGKYVQARTTDGVHVRVLQYTSSHEVEVYFPKTYGDTQRKAFLDRVAREVLPALYAQDARTVR